MKAVKLIILSLVLNSGAAFASSNVVEKLLPNIRDRVRQCTIQTVTFDENHTPTEHALVSHCPEVKVLPRSAAGASAKIRVAGHQFIARLIETDMTDGDFYDVEIRDLASNETYRLYNVLAFGDVLLGVLEGKNSGVQTIFQ